MPADRKRTTNSTADAQHWAIDFLLALLASQRARRARLLEAYADEAAPLPGPPPADLGEMVQQALASVRTVDELCARLDGKELMHIETRLDEYVLARANELIQGVGDKQRRRRRRQAVDASLKTLPQLLRVPVGLESLEQARADAQAAVGPDGVVLDSDLGPAEPAFPADQPRRLRVQIARAMGLRAPESPGDDDLIRKDKDRNAAKEIRRIEAELAEPNILGIDPFEPRVLVDRQDLSTRRNRAGRSKRN